MSIIKSTAKVPPSREEQEALQRIFDDATMTVAQADDALKDLPPMPYGAQSTSPGERTIVAPRSTP